MGKVKYAFVMSAMNKTGFDFFGEIVEATEKIIKLRNPLDMQYSDESMFIGLAPLHLPLGCIDVTRTDNCICLPLDGVSYYVEFEEGDSDEYAPIVKMYKDFFTEGMQ